MSINHNNIITKHFQMIIWAMNDVYQTILLIRNLILSDSTNEWPINVMKPQRWNIYMYDTNVRCSCKVGVNTWSKSMIQNSMHLNMNLIELLAVISVSANILSQPTKFVTRKTWLTDTWYLFFNSYYQVVGDQKTFTKVDI